MRRTPSTPPTLPGYDFVRLLGSGGFSDVFLYEQRLPRRKVAVKVLLADELTSANRAAFVDEANLMAQLSTHPYIVTIYHADVADGDRPFFVMEYCSGPSLSERYKRAPFEVVDALRTGVRLSSAIATAHAAGILHRDIKPANVLTNDYGWPALTDFGISSSVEDDLPVHTTTLGSREGEGTGGTTGQSVGMSVPWSPPEMFDDDPEPDVRSDVFSLAATIHTLLAGRTPFEVPGRSNGTLELIGRIERGVVTPIGRDDVPRSLVAVLQKGMAARRDDRFASAVDFARALQRVELELGYAPTPIDVPNLELAPRERAGDDTGDETRVRAVATVQAQPRIPAPSPADADETRARATPTVVDPQEAGTVVRSTPAVVAQPAAVDAGDATIVKPRRDAVPAVAAQGSSAPEPDEETVDPAQRRRGRIIGIAISAAALVLAASVTAGIAISGGVAEPPPSSAPPATGGTALLDTVPSPVDVVGEPSPDGAAVVFTWRNPEPEEGDRYRWWRSEQPGAKTGTAEATATVPTGGGRVCIQVDLVRGSEVSSAAEGCVG